MPNVQLSSKAFMIVGNSKIKLPAGACDDIEMQYVREMKVDSESVMRNFAMVDNGNDTPSVGKPANPQLKLGQPRFLIYSTQPQVMSI